VVIFQPFLSLLLARRTAFLCQRLYHEAVKIFMPAKCSKPVYAPYIEHVPPDTTAAI
jgi:hypothetical protein